MALTLSFSKITLAEVGEKKLADHPGLEERRAAGRRPLLTRQEGMTCWTWAAAVGVERDG